MKKTKIIIVSGYFDPLHIGHIRCLEEARKLGSVLFVIVNTDEQAINKKGYVFMPLQERLEIVRALKGVEYAIPSIDKDATVCKSLKGFVEDAGWGIKLMSGIDVDFVFANGGDRNKGNVPEAEICEDLGIKMVFGVGGDKIQSSSELVKKYCLNQVLRSHRNNG